MLFAHARLTAVQIFHLDLVHRRVELLTGFAEHRFPPRCLVRFGLAVTRTLLRKPVKAGAKILEQKGAVAEVAELVE